MVLVKPEETPDSPALPQQQPEHAPGRRPVYRYTSSNRIDDKHTANDLSMLAANLLGGVWHLIVAGILLFGIGLFAYHWYTSTDIGHESITSLQSMPCSKFNSLSEGDQQAVASRLFAASGAYANSDQNGGNINNEMGSGNELLNIQYVCEGGTGTVSQ